MVLSIKFLLPNKVGNIIFVYYNFVLLLEMVKAFTTGSE